MPAEETLALTEEPTVANEAHDPPGIFPTSAQEVGYHHFERLEGAKGLVTKVVFKLIPRFFAYFSRRRR
jgi:hypothetical protein